MAAFNFPNSPNTNDTHTENGVQWKWNGSVWKRVETTGPQGQQGHQGVQGSTGSTGPSGSMPSGTKMLFHQSSAPTGWTKQTANNERALRVVSGNTGGNQGGSNDFTTAFNSSRSTSGGSVGNRTLSTSQIPQHNHPYKMGYFAENDGNLANPNNIKGSNKGHDSDNNAFTTDRSTSDQSQGGSSHDHGFTQPSINLNVRYTDVIIASKD